MMELGYPVTWNKLCNLFVLSFYFGFYSCMYYYMQFKCKHVSFIMFFLKSINY